MYLCAVSLGPRPLTRRATHIKDTATRKLEPRERELEIGRVETYFKVVSHLVTSASKPRSNLRGLTKTRAAVIRTYRG